MRFCMLAEYRLLESEATVVRLLAPLPKPKMFSVLPPDQYRFHPDDRLVPSGRSGLGGRGRGSPTSLLNITVPPFSSLICACGIGGAGSANGFGLAGCGIGLLMDFLNAEFKILLWELRLDSLLGFLWTAACLCCWFTLPMRMAMDEKEP